MEDASDFDLQGYYLQRPKDTDTMEDTPFTKSSILYIKILKIKFNNTYQFQIAV